MASSEYFDIGMELEVTNRFHEKYRGEVVAFDSQTKTMVLSILFNRQRSGNHGENLVKVAHTPMFTSPACELVPKMV